MGHNDAHEKEVPSPGVSQGKRCRTFPFPGAVGEDAMHPTPPDGTVLQAAFTLS